jgi:hypothetical protein
LTSYNDALIAGSLFIMPGDDDPFCVGRWNGASWAPVGQQGLFSNGLDGSVYALATYRGELIAGGQVSVHWARWGPIGPFAPADLDHDCDVDADDLDVFAACATGPGVPYQPDSPPPGCHLPADLAGRIAADLDHDADIDQADFAIWQRCFSGRNLTAAPDCAD